MASAAVAAGAAVEAASAAEIATAAAAAISVASTAYSFYAADQNAKAQEKAANKHNDEVIESTIANYDQLSEVELADQQQALESSVDMQKDYLTEKGRVNVMAAYSGTTGMSVESELSGLERDKYANFNTIQLNEQAQLDNVADQAEALKYQAQGVMNVTPISRPSWASAALDMTTETLNGATNYDKAKRNSESSKPAQLHSGG